MHQFDYWVLFLNIMDTSCFNWKQAFKRTIWFAAHSNHIIPHKFHWFIFSFEWARHERQLVFFNHPNESLLLSCHNFWGFICCTNSNNSSNLGVLHCNLHSSNSITKWPKFPTRPQQSRAPYPQVNENWNGDDPSLIGRKYLY